MKRIPLCFLIGAASVSAAVVPFTLTPLEGLSPEPAHQPAAPAPAVPDSLTLDQSLQYALEHNFAIRQARQRLREQEGLIVEVKAAVLPNAALTAGYSRYDADLYDANPGQPSNYQNWQVALTVRQLIYSGGGVSAALDAARSTRSAALLDLQATVNEVLLDVRTKYADVLLNRARITVQEQNVALLEEQLATTRNRFEAGSVSQFEVLRSEVALANAKPALIRARNAFRNAIEDLRAALGYQNELPSDLKKIPEFTGELVFTPVSYELESALAAARAKRPELQRLEQLAKARESGLVNARSGYKPELYLTGGYMGRKSGLSNAFSDTLDGWTVGVEGSWAVFDGNRTRGKVAQARAQLNQARLGLSEQTLAIEVEVRRSLSSLQEAAELAGAAEKVVEQADEALRLADVRYSNGAATQLDVLESRVALTEARLNRVEANYRHTVALAALRKAIAEADTYQITE
jgi:outer membrane protein